MNRLLMGMTQADFSAFLGANGLVELHLFASDTQKMPVIAMEFIRWLNANPLAVLETLDALIQEFPAAPSTPVLASARQRFQREAATIMPLTPWEVALVEGVPIINRTILRNHLENMENEYGPKVVLVDGPKGTGRSHSFFLINHVALCWNRDLIRIDVDRLLPDQRNLPAIATRLVGDLRIAGFEHPDTLGITAETMGVRYAENFASALRRNPPATRKWLVFDSLERHALPEVRAFICTLISMRLRHDLLECTFFLLGAGSEYVIDDPYLQVANEQLGIFSADEIDTYVARLNELGSTPLPAPLLTARSQALQALLLGAQRDTICAAVCRQIAQLRKEVAA